MNIKRLLTSFAKPPGKDSASGKLFEYIIDIKDISSMVYNSVNSIGFLVGLEERQFQFSFRDEISLTTLFSNLIAEMTHLRPSVSFKKNNETTAAHKGGSSTNPSAKLEKKISGLSTLSACRIEFEDAFSFNEILNTTADSRENDQLPRVFIRSNAICCRILFSSALHIAYLLWHHSYADPDDEYVPDEDRISINIKLEENNKTPFLKSLGSKASRIVTIRVEFEWKDEYAFPYFIHDEKDEDFVKLPFKPYLQSLCLICEKIVSTYDGYFEIFPSKISFTIIGEKVTGYSYTNANDNTNTDTSKSTDTDSEVSSPHFNQQRAKELENDAETVSTFLSSKACLFISDAKMETLALETIKNLLRDKSIDTFQNIGDIIISLYSIIFVQTTAQAELIIRNERKKFDRNERFDGKIILLSEQLCFLGDELKQNYHIDYGLSLPTSNEELKSFQIWVLNYKSQLIRSKLRLERRGTTRSIEENEMIVQQSSWYYRLRLLFGYETINAKSFDSDYNFATSSSTLDATSTRVGGERSTFTYRGRRLSLWSSYLDVTSKVKKDDQISAYHDPRMDIFLKWNFFAVPSRGIGRTLHMDVIIPLYFVFNLFLVILNVRSFQALQGIIILVGSTYFRGIIHDFLLKPFGIPYKAFYFLWIGVIITSIIFSFLGDILRISFLPLPPHRWEFPPEGFHSFYEFLVWNHCWGLVATFNTIIVIPDCQLAIMSVLLPFPYSFILVIGYMAKAMGIWILYLSMFAETQQIVLGLGILLFFCVFFAYTQYFNYKGLQEEFLAIYNLLLSEDYLDRILGIANDQIIENYLQTIVQREQHLLLQLKEYLTLKQLLLDDSQIYTIRQILFNQLMIQKLCFHFETSSNKDYFLSKPSKPSSLTLPKKPRKVSSWWKSLLRGSKELIRRSFGASKVHTTDENDLTRQSFLYDMKAHLLSSILQEIYEVYYLPSNSNNSSNNPPIPLYFYIHPAITMLRINRLLFLTSIIDLLELAIQNIQHLQQQERNHEFSDLYGDSSNKRTLNQQSLQHQLLIWIEPVKSKEILRFSQVRQLEITLLDTSYLGLSVKDIQQIREKSYYLNPSSAPSSTSSPSSSPASSASSGLPTLPMTELLYSRFHNISDNFIHFFKFHSNESNAGVILNHPEYHCYYKISLPYILCTSSYQLEQIMRQNLSLRHQKELGNPLSKNRFKPSQSMTATHLKQSERNGIANNSDIQSLREFHQRFFLQYRILFNQEKRRQKEIKRLKEQEELKQSLEEAAKEKEKKEEEEGRDKNDPTTNPPTLMEVLDEAELNNQIIPKRDRSNSTDTTNTSDSGAETKQSKDKDKEKEKEGGHGLPAVSFGSAIFPPHLRQNPYHSTRRDSKNNLPPKPLRQLQSLPPNPSTPNNRSSPNTSFVSSPYLGNSRGGEGGGGYIGSMKIFHLYKSDTSLIINQLIELFQKKDWKCVGMNLLFKKNKGSGGGGSSGGSVGGGGGSGDRGRHHHYSSTYSTKIKGQVPPHSYSSTSTVGHVEQQQHQQYLQSNDVDDENTLSYRFPNKSEFIDDDILIIEYAPLERYHDEMPYDVREFIHYLRACGSMALIVVVYAPYVNIQEDQNVQLLMNPNQYSDAAVADLHQRLPWKVPILDVILKAWEEKLFQKMLK